MCRTSATARRAISVRVAGISCPEDRCGGGDAACRGAGEGRKCVARVMMRGTSCCRTTAGRSACFRGARKHCVWNGLEAEPGPARQPQRSQRGECGDGAEVVGLRAALGADAAERCAADLHVRAAEHSNAVRVRQDEVRDGRSETTPILPEHRRQCPMRGFRRRFRSRRSSVGS